MCLSRLSMCIFPSLSMRLSPSLNVSVPSFNVSLLVSQCVSSRLSQCVSSRLSLCLTVPLLPPCKFLKANDPQRSLTTHLLAYYLPAVGLEVAPVLRKEHTNTRPPQAHLRNAYTQTSAWTHPHTLGQTSHLKIISHFTWLHPHHGHGHAWCMHHCPRCCLRCSVPVRHENVPACLPAYIWAIATKFLPESCSCE
jgi:hypothetical protein